MFTLMLRDVPVSRVLFSLLFAVGVLLTGHAKDAYAAFEYIDSFETDISVHGDASFDVVENITYVFPDPKHGIFRFIPTIHPNDSTSIFRERYIDIEISSVSMDGNSVPHTIEKSGDELTVTIGDPNTEITGAHTYSIEYRVTGGISYEQYGATELYFNTTGTHWEVPIRIAKTTLHGETGMFQSARSCYRGFEGSTKSCESMIAEGDSVIFVARELGPGEGMTIAQSIDQAKIERVILERAEPLWLWLYGSLVWFVLLSWFVYSYRTANKTGKAIIPQYEPYPEVKPMYTGLLFDGVLDPRDITAGIVYLAEQGYVTIKKIDRKVLFFFEVDDYEITLLKVDGTEHSQFEQRALTLLFDDPLVVGTTVSLSELKNDLQRQKENFETLKHLRRDLEQDLEDKKFFQIQISAETLVGIWIAVIVIAFFALGALADSGLLKQISIHVVFGVIVFILSCAVLSFAMRRRTAKGYEALDHLRGFKDFLSVTEKERYEFHNAPEKSPQQFMEYLPYAIAFGVEDKWAEAFKDITIPNPNWYDGGSVSAFSATDLSTSLGAFSTAFASSSGSSSSASGGGGFSGGGGGGGGGGSW